MSEKRTVFLTGASGAWGRHVLAQLRDTDLDVVALVLPTPADLAVIEELRWLRLTVVEGDLTDYDTVARCVSVADVVLHVGAVVSPTADAHPELARKVNVGSMRNIVRAVSALPDPGAVSVVGIGSVAETGNRNQPVHWGRVGDPIRVSHFDEYGQTKVEAERILVESGLPRWTWLRQTGIFHPGMLQIRDPIMTHSPFHGVMEWVTAQDAARLLVGLCDPAAPQDVWGAIWNIGGGQEWRLTNWQLQTAVSGALGVKDVRRWYDRSWFATQNFHGQWYSDSDALDALVPFRRDTFSDAMARARAAQPPVVRMAGKVPAWIVKKLVMEPISRQPRGTMSYVRSNDTEGVDAFFGSRLQWESIGDWSTFVPPSPSRTPTLLDHGYDETKDVAEWTRDDLAQAADFRGGAFLGTVGTGGPTFLDPATWRCAEGHGFAVSPFLVLKGGHWCPLCVRDTAGYLRQAEHNPFLAQVELAQLDGRLAAAR
ncbi:NAD-dependent epimerase/dehydratase family protein [Sanguibacter sp. Leaf3]|uniref:NAD-dependent epimerase/dehydratase family protein n=1 Tax=Sanguibacter sp. Leaf3 TaxID=1736209 RepID=UPI000AE71354|nr:NAD(P)-dependent oxidoreductase [Sanguibacter sp. Leaf3]